MLPKKQKAHGLPTREVQGGFPVHFHYTAGIANEKFFEGLKDQKLLAVTCEDCDKTYLPPKFYCEDCFEELGTDFHEVGPEGELFSFTEVYLDKAGNTLDEPYFMGLIKVNGTDTTFFHKLMMDDPSIGMTVKPVWNDDREGSIFDLKGFSNQ